MTECFDTNLIQRAQAGDEHAVDSLFGSAYQQLRRLARARLRSGPRDTLLDSTSLVHEFYLRFADAERMDIQDRDHFIRYASRAMRCVIVDFVRKRLSARRGGGKERVTLNSQIDGGVAGGEKEILRIHEALDELATFDAHMAQVVEMRYFAGMTEQEIAQTLGVTDRTVRRKWEKARLLLADALN
jgi:RNA polymerase sigma factor (TIGR02999 family)